MILNTKDFKEVAKTILFAIDSKADNLFAETLELHADGNFLNLNVTNRVYYVTRKFPLASTETFKVSVNASLFLNLISKLTTDTVEITQENNILRIKANGDYKLPVIYNNDKVLELPKINIENVTNELTTNGGILNSISNYNSKELDRGAGIKLRPAQNYYYIDEFGAITFTTGACVNSFTLEKPIKLLLQDKVVRLFKLFSDDVPVKLTMGQDALTDDLIQTKVRFETADVILTAIVKDSGLISSVPVEAIRNMANKSYNYSVVLQKDSLMQLIQRLLLFSTLNNYGTLEFTKDKVTISDYSKENKEELIFANECPTLDSYSMMIDLKNFKSILDTVEDEYITVNFGDSRSLVINRANVSDIMPEVKPVQGA